MTRALDVDYPRLAVVVVLLAVNVALVGALSTSGAAYGPYNGDWDGATELRESAGESAAVEVTVTGDAYGAARPEDSVAFALAPAAPTGESVAGARRFVASGGTLVVAGQDPAATNAYLDAVGASARVDGRPLRDERNNYRAPNLPVAGNVTDHRLTEDVDSVTLNNGTVVEPGSATPLVNTSVVAYLDANDNATLDADEPLGPFPVVTVERVGSGRVVTVSDPSAFTNAMLERAGNRAFVAALLADRSTVVLDYSGAASLPPLVYALLTVRASPLLQFVVAVAAFAGLALWIGRDRVADTARSAAGLVRSRFTGGTESGTGTAPGDAIDLRDDAAAVEALLADRHPEWDEERIERVAQAISRGGARNR
jgi:hypothetical protein